MEHFSYNKWEEKYNKPVAHNKCLPLNPSSELSSLYYGLEACPLSSADFVFGVCSCRRILHAFGVHK